MLIKFEGWDWMKSETGSFWRLELLTSFSCYLYVIVLIWVTSGPCQWRISCRKHVYTSLSSIFGTFTCKIKAKANLFISVNVLWEQDHFLFFIFTPNKLTGKTRKVEMFYSRISSCLKNKIEVIQSLYYVFTQFRSRRSMNFMNKVSIRDIFVPALGQDKVNRLSYVSAGQYSNYFMFFVTPGLRR